VAEHLPVLFKNGDSSFMNKVSLTLNPPPPKESKKPPVAPPEQS
jgi:hypothetical protein